jgi:hypothetical protein
MQTESGAPVRPVTERWPLAPWMLALAWGILSFLGFVATVSVLVWPLGQLQQAGVLSHPSSLGVWAFTWVLGSGLVALAAARVVFGRWLDVRPAAWLLLIVGAVVSGALVVILAQWTIAKFGMNESDLVGPMSLLFGFIAGVAVAGFGVQVAPRGAAWSPFLAVVGGAVIGISIVLSNVPGLDDGLGRNSGPLAIVTVVAAAYIGAVGLASLARLRRG